MVLTLAVLLLLGESYLSDFKTTKSKVWAFVALFVGVFVYVIFGL